MSAKRRPDIWSPAPEPLRQAPEADGNPASRRLKPVLQACAVITTLAGVAAVFFALNAPVQRLPTTAANFSAPVSAPLAETPQNSAAPAPDTPAVPASQAAQAETPVTAMPTQALSAAQSTPAQPLQPGQAAASVPASSVKATVANTPQPAAVVQAQTSSTQQATVAAETGIRGALVVIAGRTYECYGQVAHLACDLKQ